MALAFDLGAARAGPGQASIPDAIPAAARSRNSRRSS